MKNSYMTIDRNYVDFKNIKQKENPILYKSMLYKRNRDLLSYCIYFVSSQEMKKITHIKGNVLQSISLKISFIFFVFNFTPLFEE